MGLNKKFIVPEHLHGEQTGRIIEFYGLIK